MQQESPNQRRRKSSKKQEDEVRQAQQLTQELYSKQTSKQSPKKGYYSELDISDIVKRAKSFQILDDEKAYRERESQIRALIDQEFPENHTEGFTQKELYEIAKRMGLSKKHIGQAKKYLESQRRLRNPTFQEMQEDLENLGLNIHDLSFYGKEGRRKIAFHMSQKIFSLLEDDLRSSFPQSQIILKNSLKDYLVVRGGIKENSFLYPNILLFYGPSLPFAIYNYYYQVNFMRFIVDGNKFADLILSANFAYREGDIHKYCFDDRTSKIIIYDSGFTYACQDSLKKLQDIYVFENIRYEYNIGIPKINFSPSKSTRINNKSKSSRKK